MELLCRLLQVSRSGYYDWEKHQLSRRAMENRVILRELITFHEKYPALGLNSLHALLHPLYGCSRKRIYHLMRKAGIYSARRRAYCVTTNSRHHYTVAENLLKRRFDIQTPNTAWVGDITYVPTGEGWLYTAVVKDLCTKKVVGYAFSNRIDTELTLSALQMAIRREHPARGLLYHSDRGVQYAEQAYRDALRRYGIRQSMSRRGDPYDNAVAESFFSCLKFELIYLTTYKTREAAKAAIFRYIEAFYNTVRPQSALGWIAPDAYAAQWAARVA